MTSLQSYADQPIDWDLSPEMAVCLYLEWGNNNWRSDHPPVRSKSDSSMYFVVDTWEDSPVVRLVRRNSEECTDLVELTLPPDLAESFFEEKGRFKGVFEPTGAVKEWLKTRMNA